MIAGFNADNELGPAIYAADGFEEALPYAMNGAMVVFSPDFRGLNVWTPEEAEWRHLTARWLQIPVAGGAVVSDQHAAADIIQGPVSVDQGEARKKRRFPNRGKSCQIACVSYSSCERLAKSLVAVIYLSR